MDRNKIISYFTHTNSNLGLNLFLLGLIFLIVGGALFETLLIVGVFLSIIGILIFILQIKSKKDAQVDEYCRNFAIELSEEKRHLAEVNCGEVLWEHVWHSYCYDQTFSVRRVRKGRDGIWRSSIYNMGVIFLTSEKMLCSVKKLSLITNESTSSDKELLKDDVRIVSVCEENQEYSVEISLIDGEKIHIGCNSFEESERISKRIKEFMK